MADTEFLSGDIPVIVRFTAAYCAPCRQMAPLIASLENDYEGKVRVVTVDIEREPDIAQRYAIRSVPTLLALRDGRVVEQQVGYSRSRRVEEMFSNLASG